MKFLLTIFLLVNIQAYSQTDSLKASKLEKELLPIKRGKFIKSMEISMDSVDVQVSKYQNMIETENFFRKSNTKLTIVLINNKTSTLVRIRENSVSPKDFWLIREFYFENEKLFYENESYYISGRMHGIPITKDMDKDDRYGYNKSLDSTFLQLYISDLLDKINNYR